MKPNFCPYCGHSLGQGQHYRFCPKCGKGLQSSPSLSSGDDVLNLLQQGKFIPAVRSYRNRTGLDLKTAKLEVEKMAQLHQIPIRNSSAGLIAVALAATLILGISVAVFIFLSAQ